MDLVSDIREHCKKCGYLWRCKYCAVEYKKEKAVRAHHCRSDVSDENEEDDEQPDGDECDPGIIVIDDEDKKSTVQENKQDGTVQENKLDDFVQENKRDDTFEENKRDDFVQENKQEGIDYTPVKKKRKLKGTPQVKKKQKHVQSTDPVDSKDDDVSCFVH